MSLKNVIPTVFATSVKDFTPRFKKVLASNPINIHIDFMDGKLVKANGIPLTKFPNLKRLKPNFEAHLMVKSPSSYISKLKEKGFNKIIIHIESSFASSLPNKIRDNNMSAWLAINPKTPLKKIISIHQHFDGILFMGVVPGKESQSLLPSVLKKIKSFHAIFPNVPIQVDGGVNLITAPKLKKLHVTNINSGSFISSSIDPSKSLNQLSRAFK